MVFLINPFTPSHLLAIPSSRYPPISFFMGLGLARRHKYWGPLFLSLRLSFSPSWSSMPPPSTPPFFLSLNWVFTFLKAVPLPKPMLERNNERKHRKPRCMDSNWPVPCLSQPKESVVCGCGLPSFVPGNRVIYLTQAEPTELYTYQSIPSCLNNNTDWCFRFSGSFFTLHKFEKR